MKTLTHPELVTALVKPAYLIIDELTIYKADLWHAATGISGEAGELLEAILFPPPSGVDRVNLVEELGDLYFYVEQALQRTGISIDYATFILNADKAIATPGGTVRAAASIAVHGSQVLDTVKKGAVYNKEIDRELLTNQLSALVLAMITLGYSYDISREEALAANIAKLSVRYKSLGYTDAAAHERADKPLERKPFPGEPVS